MPALLDAANLFGMVRFYRAAREAGVKPLIGADCWGQNDADREKPYRLLLLCASHAGYLRLCELLSRAWLRNQYRGRAELAIDWLDRTDGLIAPGAACRPWRSRRAPRARVGRSISRPLLYRAPALWAAACRSARRALGRARLAARRPVVATHPVQFLDAEDFRAHEARVCIASGHILGDLQAAALYRRAVLQAPGRDGRASPTSAGAGKLDGGRAPLQSRHHARQEPASTSRRRRGQRRGASAKRSACRPERRGLDNVERLEFELKTIIQMGFAGYFLIVADFINWAKSNGVPVGPGRGSGAGSLVAYALGITDLEPQVRPPLRAL